MSLLSPEVTSQKTPSFLLPFFSFDDLSKSKTLKIMLITNKRKGKSESRKQAKKKKEKEQNGQERTSYWNPPQKKSLSVPIYVRNMYINQKKRGGSRHSLPLRTVTHRTSKQHRKAGNALLCVSVVRRCVYQHWKQGALLFFCKPVKCISGIYAVATSASALHISNPKKKKDTSLWIGMQKKKYLCFVGGVLLKSKDQS